MKKLGFTLSEVLLTLSIIGVVSAMTVPSLMTSIEDRELTAQAKKAYNTLQSAISMKYALTRQTPADIPENKIFDEFLAGGDAPVLKYTKKSGNVVQLPDGQIMTTRTGGTNCDKTQSPSYGCWVQVDINGEDGPTFSHAGDGSAKNSAGITMVKHSYTGLSSTGSGTYDRKYRDMVFFNIDGLTVTPYTGHGITKRYFSGQQ